MENLPRRTVQETGLLEQTVLLVQAPDASGRRELLAATGRPAGVAREERQRPWWRRWLRPMLSVHEVEDEPLVFQVRRTWRLRARWEVIDAEEELVGTVALPWLLDRWGGPGIEVRAGQGRQGVMLGEGGGVLGEWSGSAEGVRLEFKTAAQGDPFVKMLLLAAVLQMPVEER